MEDKSPLASLPSPVRKRTGWTFPRRPETELAKLTFLERRVRELIREYELSRSTLLEPER